MFLLVLLGLSIAVLEATGIALLMPVLQVGGDAGIEQLPFKKYLPFELGGHQSSDVTSFILIGAILTIFLMKNLVVAGEHWFRTSVYAEVAYDLRMRILRIVESISLNSFNQLKKGEMENLVLQEVTKLETGLGFFGQALLSASILAIYTAAVFVIAPLEALFVSILVLAVSLLLRRVSKSISEKSKTTVKKNVSSLGFLSQMIANFKYVKSTDSTRLIVPVLSSELWEISRLRKITGLLLGVSAGVTNFCIVCIILLLLALNSYFVGKSISVIALGLILMYRGLGYFQALQTQLRQISMQRGSIESVLGFIADTEQRIQEEIPSKGAASLDEQISEIELVRASFSHDEEKILDAVDLKVKRGDHLVLFGPSGGGKSTLIDLLIGAQRPSAGELRMNGKVVAAFPLNYNRDRVGLVSQSPVVFNESVANNLSLWGGINYSNEELTEALRISSFDEVLDGLTSGLETKVGAEGVDLSGGQKQRLVLARELLRNPEILFLDEFTSALDSDCEKKILDRLIPYAEKRNITLFAISHKYSTVIRFKRIVLIKSGKIVQELSPADIEAESFDGAIQYLANRR